jgi:imidazolonepropionase-like amidohydrolase
LDIAQQSFQNALAAKVNIAFGTDAGFNVMLHGENGKEFASLVDYGMSPMQAIQSATSNAAKALHMEDSLGTIEKGKLADIIVIAGDPLETMSVFRKKENFALVMKEGCIYKKRL